MFIVRADQSPVPRQYTKLLYDLATIPIRGPRRVRISLDIIDLLALGFVYDRDMPMARERGIEYCECDHEENPTVVEPMCVTVAKVPRSSFFL